ncbi:MAG: hypothetical protein ABSG86_11030 [Thermoguttaceae bacterium]|jgi:hypothetical protein
MAGRRHSKEEIIDTLKSLARDLGKTWLSKAEVQRVLPTSSVRGYFASLGKASQAAGLESRPAGAQGPRRVLSDEDLFTSIQSLERKLGREPGANEYCADGKYSITPFKDRFGARWGDILARYRKWKAERDQPPARDGAVTNSDGTSDQTPVRRNTAIAIVRESSVAPKQLYGEPFDFRGLRHAPINEQGVVYLFGMVSRELGFYVESIQQGFPDCEAKYCSDKKRNLWARARIELEFKASAFREHGHDAAQCDFIVCWIDDWPDSPLPVIELKKEIAKLPSR